MRIAGAALIFLIAVVAMGVILIKLLRCVHAWELVDKTELPSGFENMAKAGVQSGSMWPSDYIQRAKKTVIIAMRCPKCGAARIYKETA